ncbi:hypothetical protein IAR50_004290 [Cryptococcus sp. DSM 104548]
MPILPLYRQPQRSSGTLESFQSQGQPEDVPMEILYHRGLTEPIELPAPVYTEPSPRARTHVHCITPPQMAPLQAIPVLTTLTPLAPVHDLILALLLNNDYLGPSRTMALSPGVLHHVKYDVYRQAKMSRALLQGLDKGRRSRARKLDCLKCVRELTIDTMEGMWDLASLHSRTRSVLFRPFLNIFPNVEVVRIHRRVIVGQYILERRWDMDGYGGNVEVPWGELKDGMVKQLGGSTRVVFYGKGDEDRRGRPTSTKKLFTLPGRLLLVSIQCSVAESG